MQLMWMSGPTASVRTVSITARKVLVGLCVSSFFLIVLGVLLHFIGFRIAVEISPGLARSLGGVTTEAEQQKVEAVYRNHLDELRQKLSGTVQQIRELETLKNRFMEVATPNNLRDKSSKKEEARGGPWVPPRLDSHLNEPLSENFTEALEQFSQIEVAAKNLSDVWQSQLNWLNALPTGVPVAKDFHMTSGFGVRNDPFTGQMAMHEGLDFVAPAGTPILASAGGTVTRSEWENSFGNLVEVTHIEGFTTRYAHMSKRIVKEGQKVNRGDQLGLLGSTGRSTGPHLHYEVMRNDRVINPIQMLVQASNP